MRGGFSTESGMAICLLNTLESKVLDQVLSRLVRSHKVLWMENEWDTKSR